MLVDSRRFNDRLSIGEILAFACLFCFVCRNDEANGEHRLRVSRFSRGLRIGPSTIDAGPEFDGVHPSERFMRLTLMSSPERDLGQRVDNRYRTELG